MVKLNTINYYPIELKKKNYRKIKSNDFHVETNFRFNFFFIAKIGFSSISVENTFSVINFVLFYRNNFKTTENIKSERMH